MHLGEQPLRAGLRLAWSPVGEGIQVLILLGSYKADTRKCRQAQPGLITNACVCGAGATVLPVGDPADLAARELLIQATSAFVWWLVRKHGDPVGYPIMQQFLIWLEKTPGIAVVDKQRPSVLAFAYRRGPGGRGIASSRPVPATELGRGMEWESGSEAFIVGGAAAGTSIVLEKQGFQQQATNAGIASHEFTHVFSRHTAETEHAQAQWVLGLGVAAVLDLSLRPLVRRATHAVFGIPLAARSSAAGCSGVPGMLGRMLLNFYVAINI